VDSVLFGTLSYQKSVSRRSRFFRIRLQRQRRRSRREKSAFHQEFLWAATSFSLLHKLSGKSVKRRKRKSFFFLAKKRKFCRYNFFRERGGVLSFPLREEMQQKQKEKRIWSLQQNFVFVFFCLKMMCVGILF